MSSEDWRRLAELRAAFLGQGGGPGGPGAPTPDYWRTERDLELYDAFLGRRIAWKWAGALGELQARPWRPPAGTVLDFGCGTGSAAEAYLAAFGTAGVASLDLVDRSPAARAFAGRRLGELHPDLALRELSPRDLAESAEPPAVLLVSHVLNELDGPALEGLVELARRARAVLWVEPGERSGSRRLSEVHDRLLPGARVLAPCPHQLPCGALARPDEWCHHFARPPVDAFTTREWTLFARELSVDLRSLPYSWLALERPAGAPDGPEPPGLARILGRAHTDKGRLMVHACMAGEVRELLLRDRDAKPLAKLLREPKGRPLLLRLEVEDGRILSGEPWPAPDP